jgi:hypothetical protein
MKFRKLHAWKYQLVEDFEIQLPFMPPRNIATEFVRFYRDSVKPLPGYLALKRYYAWDGASGPCPDTRPVMRGALVHDALYQLIRLDLLPREPYRKLADGALRDICIQSGMNPIWARIIYWGVRVFAGKGAEPLPEPPVISIP